MKTRLTIFIGLLCLKVFSQASPAAAYETPNFAPKSPEAAAFLKYGEYPVDLSTGVPSVSIPLYTITGNGVDIPISLDYHASGIKVTQESTWVGLGWNLNVGAQIVLSARDDVDENNPYIDVMPDADALAEHWDFHNYEFNEGPVVTEHLEWSRIKDVYSLSSPTANGSFYIRKLTGGVPDIVIFPPDAFKVEVIGLSRANLDFVVTDTSGNKYFFTDTKEISVRTMTHSDTYTSAWFVDEIQTPSNDTITFSYQDDIPYAEGSLSQRLDITQTGQNCGCGDGSSTQYPTGGVINSSGWTTTTTKKIHEIVFNRGQSKIVFTMDSGREDLINSNSYLEKMEVKQLENGTFYTKKGYTFSYSYFHPSTGSNFNYKDKRLRLNNIASIIDGETHQFVYNDSIDLPSKDSFARDYFGYFNDYGGLDMIPKHYVSAPYNLFVGNANKKVNPAVNQAGILTEIHYPTKGWTKFLYETNQYFGVDQFDRYEQHTVPGVHTVSGFGTPTSHPIDIPTAEGGHFAECQEPPTNGCINYGYFEFNAVNALGTLRYQGDTHGQSGPTVMKWKYWRVRVFNGDGTTAYDTDEEKTTSTSLLTVSNLNLNGMCYILTEAYGSSIDVYAELSYFNNDTTPKNLLGGGLRISAIENYNHDNTLQIKKGYEYNDVSNSTKTSGKLVNSLPVSFSTNAATTVSINPCPCGGPPCGLYFGSNYQVVYSLTSDSRYGIEGNSVVYEFVKEKLISIEDGTNNGYTQYKFSTTADEVPWGDPSVFIPTPWRRGKVLDKKAYRTSGPNQVLINHETNTYVEDAAKVSFIDGFKMFKHVNLQGVVETENAAWIPPTPYRLLMGSCYVPGNVDEAFEVVDLHLAIPWFYLKETKTVEKFYDDANNPRDSIITIKEFKYDNPLHQQITREISKSSSSETLETRYNYPQDVAMSSEPHISDLIAQNMVAVPLKTETYRGGTKLSEKVTKYAKDGTTFNHLLPKFIYTKKGTSASGSEKRLTYDKYDAYGNLLQYTTEGGHPVSIIWGYHHTQPVAKIENCSYASIPSSILNDIQGATDTGTETQAINALQHLREDTSTASSMVSTFTYIPLFGVSTITDPKGISTKYEYDNEGRLVRVKDHDQNVLSENEYHYKN